MGRDREAADGSKVAGRYTWNCDGETLKDWGADWSQDLFAHRAEDLKVTVIDVKRAQLERGGEAGGWRETYVGAGGAEGARQALEVEELALWNAPGGESMG